MKRTLIALTLSAAGAAQAQNAWFSGIGHGPGGENSSWVSDLSADGRYASGTTITGPESWRGLIWSRESGLELLEPIPDTTDYVWTNGISGCGTIVVSSASLDDAFTQQVQVAWTPATGWVSLGDLDGGPTDGIAWVVSDDGRVIAGQGYVAEGVKRATRWTLEDGLQDLGSLGGDDSASYAISGDGTVIGGASTNSDGYEAFLWTEADGMFGIGDLEGGSHFSVTTDINGDGSVAVGYSRAAPRWEAFMWTPDGGMVSLGSLSEDHQSWAGRVNADGSVVCGSVELLGQPETNQAAVWTEAAGWRTLDDVLAEHGLTGTTAGWSLNYITGLSADGRTIAGQGVNPDGDSEGWVVYLGGRCPGDFNEDDAVNTLDVLDFLNAWNAGCP